MLRGRKSFISCRYVRWKFTCGFGSINVLKSIKDCILNVCGNGFVLFFSSGILYKKR